MSTPASYARDLERLDRLVERELVTRLQAATTAAEVETVTAEMLAMADEVIDLYGPVGAELAAEWYDEMRDAAQVSGAYRARTVVADRTKTREALGFSLSGWQPGDDLGPAQRSLTAATSQVVRDFGRETIMENTRLDPAAERWVRMARPNACSFCAILAHRGAAYRSESTAKFQAHGHCRCYPAPAFRNRDTPTPGYYSDFGREYSEARGLAEEAGDTSMRSILSQMRRVSGRA